ncbi:hypothetical protein J6590_047327 [Homalodisca vitripennis]|nr:hypothetical protein J6590_047327 [Homalodisca vitripennis]
MARHRILYGLPNTFDLRIKLGQVSRLQRDIELIIVEEGVNVDLSEVLQRLKDP